MINKIKLSFSLVSIIVIWLFHLSGAFGIIYGNSDWFISATPLNLIISLVLLLLNSTDSNKIIMVACISFIVGM